MINFWGSRIGIFYKDIEWFETVYEAVCKAIPQNLIKHYIHSKHETRIQLIDGTIIEFISIKERCAGRRYDRMFYQDGIDDNLINVLVRPRQIQTIQVWPRDVL